MESFVLEFLVGVLLIVLGIVNRKGNITLLHSYHRQRVSEEDRLPYGKAIGLGCILIGCTIIVNSGLSLAAVLTENKFFSLIGTGVMVVGLAIGLVVIFRAMSKYNKGVF